MNSTTISHFYNNSSNSSSPQRFEKSLLAETIYGYLSPFLIFVTLVTNCLVCAVLCRKAFRSPTNMLLVAMAVSDTLTGLWPAPILLGFYSTGLYKDWVPYSWCFAYYCLIDPIPTIFHTASIWLTVCLAGQRYIYVCRPNLAKSLCTVSKTGKTIAVVYIVSIALHGARLAEMSFQPVELESLIYPGKSMVGCYSSFSPLVAGNVEAFYVGYYWTRVIAVNILPCLFLVVLNSILIHAMKKAAKRRSQLLRQNMRMESRRLGESNSTTMMLVLVVGIFLLVELPLAVFLIFVICNNSMDFSVMYPETIETLSLLINFFIMVSYPLNFFIYCRMSRQFRESFKKLVVCSYGKKPGGSSVKQIGCSDDGGDHSAGIESAAGGEGSKNGFYEMTLTRVITEDCGMRDERPQEKYTCLVAIDENFPLDSSA